MHCKTKTIFFEALKLSLRQITQKVIALIKVGKRSKLFVSENQKSTLYTIMANIVEMMFCNKTVLLLSSRSGNQPLYKKPFNYTLNDCNDVLREV